MPPYADMLRNGTMAGDWLKPCSRQALCAWRHFSRAVTGTQPGDSEGYTMPRELAAWRGFWARTGGNYTALLERFLLAAAGRHAPGDRTLRLPCYCPAASTHMGFKLFESWLLNSSLPPDVLQRHPWADSHGAAGHGARVLDVLRALGAKVILLQRATPADAFLSLQKSMVSGAWHCPTQSCVAPNTTVPIDATACRQYVSWYAAAAAAAERELARAGLEPAVRLVFEECINDQDACLRRVTDALGVAPLPPQQPQPRRTAEVLRRVIHDYDEALRQCNAPL
jgi:hypothetical protein